MTVPVPDQLEFITNGNGVTREFSYPRRFLQKNEIVVAFRTSHVDTIKSLNIDYSIAGSSWPAGGKVVFNVAPPVGVKVVLYRKTQAKQTVDLENKQRNDAKAVETQLDRLTMALQDTDRLARSALRTDSNEGYRLSPPTPERVLAWDEQGKAVISSSKSIQELDTGIADAQDAAEIAVKAKDDTVEAIDAVSGDMKTVIEMRPEIQAVISDEADIGTVADNIENVNKVALVDTSISKVASIDIDVSNVAAIDADVSRVSAISSDVKTVAGDRVNINTVASHAADIDNISTNMANVIIVADNIDKVAAVAVITTDVVAVADIKAAVQAVAAIGEDVESVARNIANVMNVAGNKSNIDIVALNIADIQNASQNMTAIKAAPDAATRSEEAAVQAKNYRDEALGVFANMKGGAVGYALVKRSSDDYDYEWLEITGLGDMTKAVFDPTGVNGDAFSMGNMVETDTAKIMTSAERTKLEGIATGATANTGTVTSVAIAVPTGLTATEAITTSGTITISYASGYQGYTIAEANKLANIQAGAQVNTVTSVAGRTGAVELSATDVGLGNVANKTEAQMVASGPINDALSIIGSTLAADIDTKLGKSEQAADSARLGSKTAAQWQAEINAGKWPGVYTGTNVDNTDFPIGTTILTWDGQHPRNSNVTVRLSNSPNAYYTGPSGTLVSGTWRARGNYDKDGSRTTLVQRVS